jgi:1-acyl-sn-glycerol-3-phosphate acyltransferase
VKSAVLRLVRLLVGLFYRRIEVTGLDNVPREGPVLFVANHFNGLVDPMLVLKTLPRPVVFVAKSTLWRIPVLSSLLDLLGCVPVVRRRDAEEEGTSKGEERNRASFEKLAEVLGRDGAILIFPEGRSHSDPRLSEMRTGAARILLLSKKLSVVVPIGLWFTRKEEFRSEVLLRIGRPVAPPEERSVGAWTEAIERALLDVTLNANDWEDHEVVAAVETLYGERIRKDFLEGEEGTGQMADAFLSRKALLAARPILESAEPDAVAAVMRRALAFNHLLSRIHLSPAALDDPPPARTVLWHSVKALVVLILGFPLAVLGVAAWYVPYRLCGVVANRMPGAAKERDQIAFHKLTAGVVLFPLAYAIEVLFVLKFFGPSSTATGAAALPFLGVLSLSYLEHAEGRERQARELLALAFMPGGIARLRATRDALVAECDRLAGVFRAATDNRSA